MFDLPENVVELVKLLGRTVHLEDSEGNFIQSGRLTTHKESPLLYFQVSGDSYYVFSRHEVKEVVVDSHTIIIF